STSALQLLNCTTPNKWTPWSNWSPCERKRFQRRRRRCESALRIDTVCLGEKVQKRKCDQTQLRRSNTPVNPINTTLPEFVWGSWSDWNEWGNSPLHWSGLFMDAKWGTAIVNDRVLRRGGGVIGANGSEHYLPVLDVLGASNVFDFDSGVLSVDGSSLTGVTASMKQLLAVEDLSQWSDWKIRPGVAFRYRLPPEVSLLDSEAAIDIQYQLLISASSTRVTLSFCLYLGALTMISGFFAQCLISKLFASCRTSKTFL
ncbi:hypothetical protein OSTOST_25213, partial [Ostertagia ostertagi]